MKLRATAYTFDKTAKTIVCSLFTSLEAIQLITNVTDNIIIYNFADAAKGGTLSGTTLTLTYDTATMADADKLQILVEDGSTTQAASGTVTANIGTVATLATAAKQDTGNTSIGNVDTKTPALGQALAAASTPVVLTAAQISTLTPPAAISGFATAVNQLANNHNVVVTSAPTTAVTIATAPVLVAGTALIGKVGIDQATANANEVVTKTGSVTTATLSAETTKVIGTVNQGTSPWVVTGGGSGTEYTEDAASAADPVGNMLIGRRRDTLVTNEVTAEGDNIAINATNKGQLHVKLADTTIVDGSGVTQPVSGTVTANAGTGTLAVSGPVTDAQLRATAVPVSGTVTANAGTNLNTSALALEAGGNLASIKAKTDNIPAQGQALAAASTPVVLTAAQVTTLTPPAAITGFATSAKQDTVDTSINTLLKPASTLAAVTTVGTVSSVTAIANALPAGTNAIGKLAANSGVDIGDVDVTTLPSVHFQDLYITGQGSQTALNNNVVLATAGTGTTDTLNGTTGISFRSLSFQVTPASGTVTAGVITFEGSNDNTNFVSIFLSDRANVTAIPVATITLAASTSRYFTGATPFRYFRARISTGITGTTTGVQAFTVFSTIPFSDPRLTVSQATAASLNATVAGSLTTVSTVATVTTLTTVTGSSIAHDGADSGNPHKMGARATNVEITAVANNDRTDLVATLTGKQIVQPYSNPENFVSGAITTAMTGTTTTSLVAAPAAGLRNYITTIIVSNTHATVGTDVIIQDGSGGTTLLTIPAAAVYGGAAITLPTPLRQPTTATALFCANVTTGASTKVSAVGYMGV